MDRCLTELEIRPEEGERLVGEIFCAVHTIKGTTGFLDFQRLEKLAHAGELISLIVIASATARCRCAGRSSFEQTHQLLKCGCCIFRSRKGRLCLNRCIGSLLRMGTSGLENAEQAEDSTNRFDVEFASRCYFDRPTKGS